MFIFKIENIEEYYRKKIPNYFFSFNINRFFSLIKKNLIVMFLVCIFFPKKVLFMDNHDVIKTYLLRNTQKTRHPLLVL